MSVLTERHAQAADLAEMLKRYPPILRQDLGELRARMAFLTKVLKLTPTRKAWRASDGSKFQWHGVVTYPLYFTLGLATYIGDISAVQFLHGSQGWSRSV